MYERDWEKFDGFTPTFTHANLTAGELMFLLGAAYSRFYIRPTYVANHLGIQSTVVRDMLSRLDTRVFARQARREILIAGAAVSC